MFTLRRLPLVTALVSAALALGACGDDDDDKTTTSAQATSPASVVPASTKVPRYAGDPAATTAPSLAAIASLDQLPKQDTGNVAPKIKGSDVPMEQFLDTFSNDAATYWQTVFNNSKLQYPETTQSIVTASVDGGCGTIDSANSAPLYCFKDSTIYLPVGYFETKVKPIGDAAVATLVSLMWGYRTYDALGGAQAVSQGKLKPIEFQLGSVCMAGAHMAYVGRRELLEGGDAEEVINLTKATADQAPGGQKGSPEQRLAAFRIGFSRGPSACTKIRVT